ncbi:MAG: hypothetical protein VKJ04_06415 [Vampirovibrionales bacterium]|nr:hypothetical protein [Vampirovibrionales bacterium]
MYYPNIQFGQIAYRQAVGLRKGSKIRSEQGRVVFELMQPPSVKSDGKSGCTTVSFKVQPVKGGNSSTISALFWTKDSDPVKLRNVKADVDKNWTVVG